EVHEGQVTGTDPVQVDVSEVPRALRDAMGLDAGTRFEGRFDLPVTEKQEYLARTSPIVEGLASYVVDTALDPLAKGKAARCGAIRTDPLQRPTTHLVKRPRLNIVQQQNGSEKRTRLAEESR